MAKKVKVIICPGCGEEVKEDDSSFMQASDRPRYKNIWWHKNCWINATEAQRKESLRDLEVK